MSCSGGNGVVLENESYGQLQAVSAVPVDMAVWGSGEWLCRLRSTNWMWCVAGVRGDCVLRCLRGTLVVGNLLLLVVLGWLDFQTVERLPEFHTFVKELNFCRVRILWNFTSVVEFAAGQLLPVTDAASPISYSLNCCPELRVL
ncbi:hypothetical protein Droror1_Dr00018497 [Drosera rotundifolia]